LVIYEKEIETENDCVWFEGEKLKVGTE